MTSGDSDNFQKLLDEYLKLNGKLMDDYYKNSLECGDNTSKATELYDKYSKESSKLFEDYTDQMMKPILDELAEETELILKRHQELLNSKKKKRIKS